MTKVTMRATQKGQQLADFTVSFGFLILCVLLPLIDLGVIPVRFLMAQNSLGGFIKQLSLSETVSQAYKKIGPGAQDLQKMLNPLGGTHVKSNHLSIVINSQKKAGNQKEVDKPRTVPKDWLPDGTNCPCQYMIKLSTDVEIEPLIMLPKAGPPIPGLNAPFVLTITNITPWENLGINPETQEYFLNE